MVGKTSVIDESWSSITGVLKEGVGDSLALKPIEESCIITVVLKEGDVVVGDSLALVAIATYKGQRVR